MVGSSEEPQNIPEAARQVFAMMDILMDTKDFVQEAKQDKAAVTTKRQASPSQGKTVTWGHRGFTAPAGSQDDDSSSTLSPLLPLMYQRQ